MVRENNDMNYEHKNKTQTMYKTKQYIIQILDRVSFVITILKFYLCSKCVCM